MLENFFGTNLQNIGIRVSTNKETLFLNLDKNEQHEDVEISFKNEVLEELIKVPWNRYPDSDYSEIEKQIAQYCNLQPDNIVLGSGSASIITALLDFFAIKGNKITIVQPSYSLFDYHCRTYNISYQSWYLTPDLQYDFENLPKLNANSVLLITSPNNPVGNSMDYSSLESLLRLYPDSLIIVDAVYHEFCNIDIMPLISIYENLIVLRSLSKAFPIAGLRLGYLCASPKTTNVVRKLLLQFSINHFSLLFARLMFSDKRFMLNAKERVRKIINERERLYKLIEQNFSSNKLKAYKSEGNFLLIKIIDDSNFYDLIAYFTKQKIKILNTSTLPLLKNTFRVSIGSELENDVFFNVLNDYFNFEDSGR